MLIGISGKIGTGKTTVADMLVSKGFSQLAFAGVLKEMVAVLLNIPVSIFDDQAVKSGMTPFGCDVRHLLQTIGTDWGREMINTDIWVISAFFRINSDNTVITDVRFPNEAKAIRERGGIVIRLERDMDRSGPEHQHLSETALDGWDFDYVIDNNGSLEDLRNRLNSTLCIGI